MHQLYLVGNAFFLVATEEMTKKDPEFFQVLVGGQGIPAGLRFQVCQVSGNLLSLRAGKTQG